MGNAVKNGGSFNIKDADKRLQVLFEISDAVNSTTNLLELYNVIHKSLRKILKVENLIIGRYDKKSDILTVPYHVDQFDENMGSVEKFSKVPSLMRKLMELEKPMLYKRESLLKEKMMGTVPQIWLGAPLVVKNSVIGAIVIQDYNSEDTYKKEDLVLLNSVSHHIAIAIERKENDDTLKEQGDILENILESSPVGIALVENRTFKWVNNEIVKVFGYNDKKDFENKSVQLVYPSKEEYERAGEIIKTQCREKGKADFECRYIRRDKSVFPAHIIVNSSDKKNPMAWTIVSIKDLSEQKIAEKEKVEHEKLQGVLEMAGAVCHELSQPLQSILGYSELLLLESEDDDMTNFNKSLDTIIEQTTRIGKITKKLSGITKYKTVDYAGDTKIFDIWDDEENS